mgnify:CR=1 FL=1
MIVWGSPFIPSHLTFKKFRIHSLSDNQSNNQSNLSIYYNIPKFRILGCYIGDDDEDDFPHRGSSPGGIALPEGKSAPAQVPPRDGGAPS